MKNVVLLLGMLFLSVGCGQVDSSPQAMPANAKLIKLDLPGMT